MKSKILILALVLGVLCTLSFTPPKFYTLKLTPAQLEQLWYTVDKSTAEHSVVKDVQTIIQQQIATQNDSIPPKK